MSFSTITPSLCLLLTIVIGFVHGQEIKGRIINGVNTQAMPKFIVSIKRVWGVGSPIHICSGVVIGSQHVLTAASCVNLISPSQFVVQAGVSDLSSTLGSTHNVWDYSVSRRTSRGNNLSVLFVEPPFVLGSRITRATISSKLSAPGDYVYLMGWGKVDPAGFLSTTKNKMLLTTIISLPDCLVFDSELEDTAVCTYSSPGQGTCGGDEGGPVLRAETMELVAIISYGYQPCGIGFPDVSTSVVLNSNFVVNAINSRRSLRNRTET